MTSIIFISFFNFALTVFVGICSYEWGKSKAVKEYYDIVIKKQLENNNNTKVEKRKHTPNN